METAEIGYAADEEATEEEERRGRSIKEREESGGVFHRLSSSTVIVRLFLRSAEDRNWMKCDGVFLSVEFFLFSPDSLIFFFGDDYYFSES